jgi:hypothetical protein
VAPILARCVERPAAYNQVFNIGADERCSVNQIAQLARSGLSTAPARSPPPAPTRRSLHAYASHTRVQSCFGDLQRHIGLEQGIRRMAAWAQTLQPSVSNRLPALKCTKGFPLPGPPWTPPPCARPHLERNYGVPRVYSHCRFSSLQRGILHPQGGGRFPGQRCRRRNRRCRQQLPRCHRPGSQPCRRTGRHRNTPRVRLCPASRAARGNRGF